MNRPLRRIFRLASRDDHAASDAEAELDLHQHLLEEELIGRGIAAGEARRQAREAMAGRRRIAGEMVAIDRSARRKTVRGERLSRLGADLRLAARGLRRDPWFALAGIVLVALGVGANAGIFSVVNAAFFRPLPYPAPDRLVSVLESRRGHLMRVAG
ncbi:MAG: hypothetical protein AB7L66_17190, partial [Gemmatimonadales bacterium]